MIELLAVRVILIDDDCDCCTGTGTSTGVGVKEDDTGMLLDTS